MSVKKFFLATSAMALFAGSAFADGGPTPESPPPPPPVEEEHYTPPPPAPEVIMPMWYAEVHGGAVWLSDMTLDTDVNTIGTDIDTGWAAGGALGYRYDNGFRAEIEGTYRRNEGLGFDVLNPFLNAPLKATSLSFMLNGIYDFDMDSFLTPYIGAGLGATHVNLNFEGEGEDDAWAFAYQFIGGFSFPMPNTAIEFFADYRYMKSVGLETDFGGDVVDQDEYESHNVMGGLRFNF